MLLNSPLLYLIPGNNTHFKSTIHYILLCSTVIMCSVIIRAGSAVVVDHRYPCGWDQLG